MRKSLVAGALVFAASLAAIAPSFLNAQPADGKPQAGTYKLDPVHSYAIFNVTHANFGTSWGRVNNPEGTLTVNDDGTLSVEVTMDLNKIDTANAQRDNHLKGPDFFNVQQFPTMTFKSTSSKPTGNGNYEVTGDLTIKGVSKPLTVTITKVGEGDAPRMGHRVGYDTSFTVNRMDYGVNYGAGMLSNDVKVMISVEAQKQ